MLCACPSFLHAHPCPALPRRRDAGLRQKPKLRRLATKTLQHARARVCIERPYLYKWLYHLP